MKNMWPLSAFLSFWVQHQHITEYHHLSSHLNRERKKTHVNDSKKKATQTINNNNRAMNSTQRKKSIYWISLSFRFKIFDQTKTRKSEKRMRQSTEPGGSLRKRIRMRSQFHSIDPHSWKILSFFYQFFELLWSFFLLVYFRYETWAPLSIWNSKGSNCTSRCNSVPNRIPKKKFGLKQQPHVSFMHNLFIYSSWKLLIESRKWHHIGTLVQLILTFLLFFTRCEPLFLVYCFFLRFFGELPVPLCHY